SNWHLQLGRKRRHLVSAPRPILRTRSHEDLVVRGRRGRTGSGHCTRATPVACRARALRHPRERAPHCRPDRRALRTVAPEEIPPTRRPDRARATRLPPAGTEVLRGYALLPAAARAG